VGGFFWWGGVGGGKGLKVPVGGGINLESTAARNTKIDSGGSHGEENVKVSFSERRRKG